ncbi:MAG: hypothetical protein HRU33_01505 [Rhodobacteraceae bacterium]|nr:hypothetical protein [Paracoccaceae bacterium]
MTAGQRDEWFFLFVILDHLSHQAIHLNYWSENPRPPQIGPDTRDEAKHNLPIGSRYRCHFAVRCIGHQWRYLPPRRRGGDGFDVILEGV